MTRLNASDPPWKPKRVQEIQAVKYETNDAGTSCHMKHGNAKPTAAASFGFFINVSFGILLQLLVGSSSSTAVFYDSSSTLTLFAARL